MRTTNMALKAIVALTHLQWRRLALVALVVLANVIVAFGCSAPPHH